MRSKVGFTIGIVLAVLGIVAVLYNFLFSTYAVYCSCPSETPGHLVPCCVPPLSFYYPAIVGLAVLVIGLSIIIYSIRRQKAQTATKIETPGNLATESIQREFAGLCLT